MASKYTSLDVQGSQAWLRSRTHIITLPRPLSRLMLLMGALQSSWQPALAQAEVLSNHEVTIYFFWRPNCRHCDAQKPMLERLQQTHPELRIVEHDLIASPEGRNLLEGMASSLGFEVKGVPITIIGERYWVGFNAQVEADIISTMERCLSHGCTEPRAPPPGHTTPGHSNILNLPLTGQFDLDGHSLLVSTVVIAFVDGFNPCSLWVLSLLLALVLNVPSRKRIALVGGVFLLVTAAVYGVFMAGLFKVMAMMRFIDGVRVAVAMLAMVFAMVNIKDYFWFQKGLSFTISDKHKPGIYKKIRGIMASGKSPTAMVLATVSMALGVSLVELPCTAGFPVLWSNLLTAHGVSSGQFAALLGVYMVIYLLDELVVFAAVVITLKASKLQDKQGRLLKLVGGGVMMALAVVLLVKPEIMNSLQSSLVVFAAAFAGIGVVILVHRVVLPRFGIFLGSEFNVDRFTS